MKWNACAMLLCACAPAVPERLPRILGASPTGPGIPPDDVVAVVTFSEPIDPAGVEDGRRIALCPAANRAEVTGLADSPGGIPPGSPVVAAHIALADGGKRAELRPTAPLEPLTSYALIVGSALTASGRPVLDPEGRRRAFVSSFDTGPMPDRAPPVPRWALPPHGPVPQNLRSVRVAFDEPVGGALALRSGPAARPVALTPQLLGLDLDGPLGSGPLTLSLAGVRDASGNPATDLEPLPVSACEDSSPPFIVEEIVATPGELGIRIDAEAGELARLGVEAMSPPEEQACGALPWFPETTVVWGDMLPCVGADPCSSAPRRCALEAAVGGLCPGRRVLLRLTAEDLAGNRSPWGPWREVATLPGVPRPVITEVLADAAAPEASGEYVEVANVGTADADLAGYTLAKRTASGLLARCPLEPLAGPVPPGGHALVVGGAYDGRYRLADGVLLYRCGASALLGGLANDRAPALQLEAPEGEMLSSFGMAAPSVRCTERSVERIHPGGPDTAANYACTNSSIGTPGACNSNTPVEECPRRPW
jgi:hypothetical protein